MEAQAVAVHLMRTMVYEGLFPGPSRKQLPERGGNSLTGSVNTQDVETKSDGDASVQTAERDDSGDVTGHKVPARDLSLALANLVAPDSLIPLDEVCSCCYLFRVHC